MSAQGGAAGAPELDRSRGRGGAALRLPLGPAHLHLDLDQGVLLPQLHQPVAARKVGNVVRHRRLADDGNVRRELNAESHLLGGREAPLRTALARSAVARLRASARLLRNCRGIKDYILYTYLKRGKRDQIEIKARLD